MKKTRHNLSKSEVIATIPLACSDETTAVSVLRVPALGQHSCCVKCGSVDVYKMKDATTGQRNKRFLWRCRDCKEQYTVRIGTVYEEITARASPLVLCFLAGCTSKKGVSALGNTTALPD